MERVQFVVDETPYACWDLKLLEKNLAFIEGIDSEYFGYVADAHLANLDGEDRHRAALALRAGYSQGLEALFSLLCSLVQAPLCVVGWMTSYKVVELKRLVGKISRGDRINSRLDSLPTTWMCLSQFVHENVGLDAGKKKSTQEGFGRLWSGLANDFLDEKASDEYNSAKHGLRTKLGGFHLAVGIEDVRGIPAAPEAMHSTSGSEYGTSYFYKERIFEGNQWNFRPRRHSRNWSPDNIAQGLYLLAMSINNVKQKLRILNKVKAEECAFICPEKDEDFDAPWRTYVGALSFEFDTVIETKILKPLTKKQILRSYEPDNGATG